MSQSSTKRLSPERIAEIRRLAVYSDSILPCELLGHIEAIEAELQCWKDQAKAKVESQKKELAEAKAEIARLNLMIGSYQMERR